MNAPRLPRHAKKLTMIAIGLVAIALLVGGEDNPGLLPQMAQDGSRMDRVSETPPSDMAEPPARIETAQPPEGSALSDWYANSTPPPADDTVPVDESHLINDTQPLVTTDPIVP